MNIESPIPIACKIKVLVACAGSIQLRVCRITTSSTTTVIVSNRGKTTVNINYRSFVNELSSLRPITFNKSQEFWPVCNEFWTHFVENHMHEKLLMILWPLRLSSTE